MKLKLEIQDNRAVLAISDAITQAHIPILKAGLNKLIQSGKHSIILDLGALKKEDFDKDDTVTEIAGLKEWALENDTQLAIVSSLSSFGAFATREAAIQSLESPIAKLLALEGSLKSQLKTLDVKKSGLEARLSSVSAGAAEAKELQRKSSDLTKLVRNLELQIEAYLKVRIQPNASDPIEQKTRMLNQVLIAVLEQEGILPVR